MYAPGAIGLLSLAGIILSLVIPAYRDLLLLAGSCFVASLLIWVRDLLRLARKHFAPPVPSSEDNSESPLGDRNRIILDGSNIMHWNGKPPDLGIVATLVRALESHGYRPGVIFDANAGYLIADHYMHDEEFALLLDIPHDQVMVVPKGTPADLYILQAAQDLGAQVITNDGFRDWRDRFPETANPDSLIRGGYRDGAPYLKHARQGQVGKST